MIINSLLSTDLYKFSMMQAVFHQCPSAFVRYAFKCRNKSIDFRPVIDNINSEIDHLCTLKLKEDERYYLKSLRFIKPNFVDFLHLFKLNREFINVSCDDSGKLSVKIEGPWVHTILFEVPVLAIINECYFRQFDEDANYAGANSRLVEKIRRVKELNDNDFKFVDFGTRRRFSGDWQEKVVSAFKFHLPNNFVGTSNVYLAKQYNLTPIGTMAHEWFQGWQQLGPRLVDSQKVALQKWADEYRGDLGIALSDIIGMDAFLNDFDMYFAKLFDGCRHDSGDAWEWCWKLIKHYKNMGIDPKTKTAVFSDGLTIGKALNLFDEFNGQIKTSFGIGTNLTNDFPGLDPLQIVIKMVECNGAPTAKLSDSSGKVMCEDKEFVKYLSGVFGKEIIE